MVGVHQGDRAAFSSAKAMRGMLVTSYLWSGYETFGGMHGKKVAINAPTKVNKSCHSTEVVNDAEFTALCQLQLDDHLVIMLAKST